MAKETSMQSERMGELFVRHGLITSDQLYNALEKQRQLGGNKHLGEMLVSMGLVSERDRVRILGEHWGVNFIDLTQETVNPLTAAMISQDLARRYKVIPVALEGN